MIQSYTENMTILSIKNLFLLITNVVIDFTIVSEIITSQIYR